MPVRSCAPKDLKWWSRTSFVEIIFILLVWFLLFHSALARRFEAGAMSKPSILEQQWPFPSPNFSPARRDDFEVFSVNLGDAVSAVVVVRPQTNEFTSQPILPGEVE